MHFMHRWLLRSRHIEARVPVYDLKLTVTPADVVGRHLYKYREYEPELAAALASHVKPGEDDLCLDVGANIGWYSLLLWRLSAGRAAILCFEPDPDNFALLQRNLAQNDAAGVQPFQLAAGSEPGTLALHRYGRSNTGRHSLLPLHAGESVPVEVVTLDDFLDTHGLGDTPVKCLKMDIEGYELPALRGATRTLARTRWILLEHSPAYMRQAGLDPAELVALLADSGFTPCVPEAGPLTGIPRAELAQDPAQRNVLWQRVDAQRSP